MRAAALLFCALASGCGGGSADAFIDLRTDFVPVVEFARARVEVDRGEVGPEIHEVDLTLDYLSGVRVATFRDVGRGLLTATVVLERSDGQEVAARSVSFDVRGRVGATVLITRDCLGVACPGPDDEATRTACLGGRCVPDTCTPESPDSCGDPGCRTDLECGGGAACAVGRCRDGACLVGGAPGACDGDLLCHPERGCVEPTESRCRAWATIDTAEEVACAIDLEGGLYCWGRNERASLGLGDDARRTRPERVGVDTYERVALARVQSCAIRSDGALLCWGANDGGELGLGDRTDRPTPERVGTERWSRVSIGRGHGCAVRDDGALHCWGDNASGQLGSPGEDSLTPRLVDAESWVDVGVGNEHSCAQRSDESVHCFGQDRNGQLGTGPGRMSTDVPALALAAAEGVSVGIDHTCALVGTDAMCWGDGTHGRVGSNPGMDVHDPTLVAGTPPLSAVHAGQHHSCAIGTDGSLWCWGRASSGQLGSASENTEVPLRVGTRTDWAAVSPAGQFTCALDTSGRIFCFGANAEGQLGTGDTAPRLQPAELCVP